MYWKRSDVLQDEPAKLCSSFVLVNSMQVLSVLRFYHPDKTDKIDHLGFCYRSCTVICSENPYSLLDGHKHVPGSLRSRTLEGQQPIHYKRGCSKSKGKRKTVRVIGSIEKFNLSFLKI